tara:strand:+ start:1582 stop:1722 length:141 start_codon:yes stop_codon:yes gene_type:complete
MAKKASKLGGKTTTNKKTRQGDGKFTKRAHNKRSKLYKKQYRGQGK